MAPEPELDRQWIDRHFVGRIGRFLEFGAFDGRTHSKTLGLIEAGWSGVLVEGNARVFLRLLEFTGLDFDFLLVDLEGITPDILAALPLDRMTRTEVVCAEKQGGPETVMDHLGPWYEQVLVTHDNVVAVRR